MNWNKRQRDKAKIRYQSGLEQQLPYVVINNVDEHIYVYYVTVTVI